MSKIATIPVFSSIVAILFFLNCQRWDYNLVQTLNISYKIIERMCIIFYNKIIRKRCNICRK